MNLETGDLIVVTAAVAESFRSFLPPLAQVRTGDPSDPALVSSVRTGEAMSVAFVGLLSLAVAAVTGRTETVWVGAAAAVIMLAGYEYALRADNAQP